MNHHEHRGYGMHVYLCAQPHLQKRARRMRHVRYAMVCGVQLCLASQQELHPTLASMGEIMGPSVIGWNVGNVHGYCE